MPNYNMGISSNDRYVENSEGKLALTNIHAYSLLPLLPPPTQVPNCGVTFEMAPYAQRYNFTCILRNNICKNEVYRAYVACDNHVRCLRSSSLAAFLFTLILCKSSSYPIILPKKKVTVKPYLLTI